MHFHNMPYMAKPLHKYPSPRGHEIYIFCRPFLGHHNYIHVLSEQCLGVQKKFLKKNSNVTLFNPKLPPPPLDGGVMKFTIVCLHTLQMLHTKFA